MGQISILIVDDEALIRLDLVDTLQRRGFRTYEADSAAEAIEMLEAHPDIRAVFTDVQMPGEMDGLALAHYVRKRWPPTILMVCSGNQNPDKASLPSSCTFIPKPNDINALGRVLDAVNEQLN